MDTARTPYSDRPFADGEDGAIPQNPPPTTGPYLAVSPNTGNDPFNPESLRADTLQSKVRERDLAVPRLGVAPGGLAVSAFEHQDPTAVESLLQNIVTTSHRLLDTKSFFHHSYLTGFEQVVAQLATTSHLLPSVETSTPHHASLVHRHINSLPPELLSSVFQILVDESFKGWETQAGSISYVWVRVLKVCRFWRQVGLATRRLFRFIDFEHITKEDAVEWWFEFCPTTDLCIWLPSSPSPATTRAIQLRPDVMTQVSRLYIQEDWIGSPWFAPAGLATVSKVSLYDDAMHGNLSPFPRLDVFAGVSDLYLTGIIPSTVWASGCLPLTLEQLSIRLDPQLPGTSAPLSNGHIAKMLHNLPVLQSLTLSLDIVVDSGCRDELNLPSLRHLTLELFEADYRHFNILIPVAKDHVYDLDFRPYPYFDLEDGSTSSMVDVVHRLLENRRGSFWKVAFDISTTQTFMVLYDHDGRVLCLQVREKHALYFGMVLDAADRSMITRATVDEGLEDIWTDDNIGRSRDVVAILRSIPNVSEFIIKHDIGFVGRDIMLGLGASTARTFFNVSDFSRYLGLRFTPLGFIGLSLLAINSEKPVVKYVKLYKMAIARSEADAWGLFLPKIVLNHIDGADELVLGYDPNWDEIDDDAVQDGQLKWRVWYSIIVLLLHMDTVLSSRYIPDACIID